MIFFNSMEPKIGRQAVEIKSKVTDNDRAMINSTKGYIGIAVSDSKKQIIVAAEAVGSEHLPGHVDKTL